MAGSRSAKSGGHWVDPSNGGKYLRKKKRGSPDPTNPASEGYSEYKSQRKRYDDKMSGARSAERIAYK